MAQTVATVTDHTAHPANPWLTSSRPRGADYDRRFDELAASGAHVHGEADLVQSLGPATVLDAGCGTGRVAIELARRGLDVVGVDLDPSMLAAARAKAPEQAWVQGDLATLDLARTFDAVVLAGNVLLFVNPGTEGAVVDRMAAHLGPGGYLVAGFTLSPTGLGTARYDELAAGAGMALVARWATWERGAFDAGSDYAVSVHRKERG